MKNLLFILICFFLQSCNHLPENKLKPNCFEISQKCELQKEIVIMKVLKNKVKAFDTNYNLLTENTWYLYLTKSEEFVKVWGNGLNRLGPQELEDGLKGGAIKAIESSFKFEQINLKIKYGTTIEVVLLETNGFFSVNRTKRGKSIGFNRL